MKFVCPQCERLVELGRFRVEGEALVLECPRCGEASRSTEGGPGPSGPSASPRSSGPGETATASPLSAPMFPSPMPPLRSVGLSSSPAASNVVMLRTAQVDAVERAASSLDGDPFAVPEGFCPKCLAVRPQGQESCALCGLTFKQLAPVTLEPPGWLAESWRALLQDWGNDRLHEQVRQRSGREGELVSLARLYRLRLASMPEDPFALRGRDEVLRLAAAPVSLLGSRPPPEPQSTKGWVLFGVFAFMFVLLSGLAWMLFRAVK